VDDAYRIGDMSDALSGFVRRHPRLFVLSGAGVSTGSGIPDYRDENGRWKRKPPVDARDFVGSAAVRRRYWARSMIGWPVIARAQPNAAHRALAQLQAAGYVHGLVTQNVDGLHQRAGSADVIELHGSIAQVICTECGIEVARNDVQRWLEAANPAYARRCAAGAPDGDADIDPADWDDFKAPDCPHCGGMLRPDVVFFGDIVPRHRVAAAMAALERADAMLVVGSSVMLFSGYRFCEAAHRMGKPLAAINLGHTRADHLLQIKIQRPCEEALADLSRGLDSDRGSREITRR
jgi:NAD-dependent SIR2 family protein deacetylase